jgi:cholesterol transport system auxiliary component
MINSRRSMFLCLALSGVIGLSACVSILPDPKPAATIYRLSVPDNTIRVAPDGKTVLNIEYPLASKVLSGTNIVVSPDGRRLSMAANAHWAERIPVQLRSLLIDTLAKTDRFTGVIPAGTTYVPYRVNISIRRFEAVFDRGPEAAPEAIVQLDVRLTDAGTRSLVSSFSAQTSVRASQASVSSIVLAQDEAAHAAMAKIVGWLDGAITAPKS